ncbi:MAG: apolipoprotein N-acyltransferase [Planctomycetes bacterium]|nr:apolipoprotein N-acyltransferase [Planctomycetota bacterium]
MMKERLIRALPLLSGILAWLSYPPADISFLAWVAYVPLLFYISEISQQTGSFGKRWLGLLWPVYLGGVLFFMLGLVWLRHVSWAGLFVLPLVLSLYWVIFAVGGYFIMRYFSFFYAAFLIPAGWVFLEYLRSFVLTGFPWLFAGHTQYRWILFIQITDIAGVYGISFVVLLVNMVIFVLIKERLKIKLKTTVLIAITVVIFTCALLYGASRLSGLLVKEGPIIGIVQGNIEQSLKSDPESAYDIYNKHFDMTNELLKSQPRPDLVVWAETMFPRIIGLDEEGLMVLKDTVALCGVPMLIGALTANESQVKERKFDIFNSAYYLDANGELLNRYDKSHLVPISEYIPFKDTKVFKGIVRAVILALSELPEVYGMLEGTNFEPFRLKVKRENSKTDDYKYGVLICYESIFPELARESVKRGADFIVNVSNDGWFKNSSELDQILAISAFRAVENKTTFVRATNTGISAIIQPSGRIYVLKNKDGKVKEVEGTWAKPLVISEQKGTFYTRWGDYFPYLCLFIAVIIIILKYLKIIDKIY